MTIRRAISALIFLPLAMAGFGRAQDPYAVVRRVKSAMARVIVNSENRNSSSARWNAFCVHAAGFFLTSGRITDELTVGRRLHLMLNSSEANERVYDATIVRLDKAANLALLKTESSGPFSSLEIGGATSLA